MISPSLSARELSPPRHIAALFPLALSSFLFVVIGPVRLLEFVTGTSRKAEVTLLPMGLQWTSIKARGSVEQSRTQTSIPWRRIERSEEQSSLHGLGAPLGLIAFSLGIWAGLATLADGLYAASPSLIALGVLLIAGGTALDLLGRVVWPSKTRTVFALYMRDGLRLRLGPVDAVTLETFHRVLQGRLALAQTDDDAASQRGSDASQV